MKKSVDNNNKKEIKQTEVTEADDVVEDEAHFEEIKKDKSIDSAKDAQSEEIQIQDTLTQTQTEETSTQDGSETPLSEEEEISHGLDQNTDSELLEKENEKESILSEPLSAELDTQFSSSNIKSEGESVTNLDDINIKIDKEGEVQKEMADNEDLNIENREQYVETVNIESMEQKDEPKLTENKMLDEKKSETGTLKINLFSALLEFKKIFF